MAPKRQPSPPRRSSSRSKGRDGGASRASRNGGSKSPARVSSNSPPAKKARASTASSSSSPKRVGLSPPKAGSMKRRRKAGGGSSSSNGRKDKRHKSAASSSGAVPVSRRRNSSQPKAFDNASEPGSDLATPRSDVVAYGSSEDTSSSSGGEVGYSGGELGHRDQVLRMQNLSPSAGRPTEIWSERGPFRGLKCEEKSPTYKFGPFNRRRPPRILPSARSRLQKPNDVAMPLSADKENPPVVKDDSNAESTQKKQMRPKKKRRLLGEENDDGGLHAVGLSAVHDDDAPDEAEEKQEFLLTNFTGKSPKNGLLAKPEASDLEGMDLGEPLLPGLSSSDDDDVEGTVEKELLDSLELMERLKGKSKMPRQKPVLRSPAMGFLGAKNKGIMASAKEDGSKFSLLPPLKSIGTPGGVGFYPLHEPDEMVEDEVEPGSPLKTETGLTCVKGRRHEQEDAHVVEMKFRTEGFETLGLQASEEFPLQLFAVFDGHAGKACAKYLEKHLAGRLLEKLTTLNNAHIPPLHPMRLADRQELVKSAMVATFESLDRSWIAHNPSTCAAGSQPGSTGVVCLLSTLQRWVVACNMGDSRALIGVPQWRPAKAAASSSSSSTVNYEALGMHAAVMRSIETFNERNPPVSAIQLTRDQDPQNPLERRRLECNWGAHLDEQGYVNHAVNMTRSFGDRQAKFYEKDDYYSRTYSLVATPEVYSIGLDKDCSFLLLACDGLFEEGVFTWNSIARRTQELLNDGKNAKAVTKELCREAVRDLKSEDNCSVLLVQFLNYNAG